MISGAIYLAIVLFVPDRIVDTLALRSLQIMHGWKWMFGVINK